MAVGQYADGNVLTAGSFNLIDSNIMQVKTFTDNSIVQIAANSAFTPYKFFNLTAPGSILSILGCSYNATIAHGGGTGNSEIRIAISGGGFSGSVLPQPEASSTYTLIDTNINWTSGKRQGGVSFYGADGSVTLAVEGRAADFVGSIGSVTLRVFYFASGNVV
jgi:hypothetical protein